MKHKAINWAATHPKMIVLLVMLVLMLTIGFTGEVAAHNPGGQEVPVCGHEHPGHNHHLPDRIC